MVISLKTLAIEHHIIMYACNHKLKEKKHKQKQVLLSASKKDL